MRQRESLLHLSMRVFAMPFDKEAIKELPAEHSLLVTMEENVQSGGFGEHVTEYVKTNGIALEVLTVALPDCYVEHGNVRCSKRSCMWMPNRWLSV